MGRIHKVTENNILISLFAIGFLFIGFYLFIPYVFQTNDDMMINFLASGFETGIPESRLLHLNIVLSKLISLLYSVLPLISWYGILLCFSHLICMVLILYVCLNQCKSLMNKIGTTFVLLVIFLYLWMPQVANIQYTVTSAIFCGTAIFCFYFTDMSKRIVGIVKINILISILVGASFCWRWKVTVMAIPFAFAVWIIKWKAEDQIFEKEVIIKYLLLPISVIIMIGTLFVIDQIYYSQPQWIEFKSYNKVREDIFDYDLAPPYDNVKELCDRYNVSEKSYDALRDTNLLVFDKNISNEFLNGLYNYSTDLKKNEITQGTNLKRVLSDYIIRILQYDRPYSIIIVTSYILLIIYSILNRKKASSRIFSLVILGVMRCLTWFVILYKGRCPERISVSLYLIELLIIIAFFIQEGIILEITKRKNKGILTFFIIVYTLILGRWGISNIIQLKDRVYNNLEITKDFKTLINYCQFKSENFYFYDVNILHGEHITENIFEAQSQNFINYAFTGGWLPNSPWYEKKYQLYNMTNAENSLFLNNVYLVFRDDSTTSKFYIYEYLEEKYLDLRMETIDFIDTDQGYKYEIVKVHGGENESFTSAQLR